MHGSLSQEHPVPGPIHGSLSQQYHVNLNAVPGDPDHERIVKAEMEQQAVLEAEEAAPAAAKARAKLILLLMVFAVRLLLVMSIVFCVGNLVGGLIYSKCAGCRPQLEDARRRSGGPGFEYGLFEGCCQSGRVCFWGCCCPNVLWSAMASSPKSRFWGLTFWQMLTLRLALGAGTLILLATCPALAGFVSLPFFAMNLLHRQHLRQKFGLEHSTCSTVFKDVYTWLCCQPCATIQEALQVGYTGDPTLGGDDDSARNVPLQMGMVV